MTSIIASGSSVIIARTGLAVVSVRPSNIAAITLWITGFLCLLNVALAIFYRKRQKRETLSYWAACVVELAVFIFAALFQLKVITHVPYHLPPGLPINRAELGAALALGMGLFPAAYWHRINLSDLPTRLAQDAKVMKDREGGVYERKSAPGEWMN